MQPGDFCTFCPPAMKAIKPTPWLPGVVILDGDPVTIMCSLDSSADMVLEVAGAWVRPSNAHECARLISAHNDKAFDQWALSQMEGE